MDEEIVDGVLLAWEGDRIRLLHAPDEAQWFSVDDGNAERLGLRLLVLVNERRGDLLTASYYEGLLRGERV